jgi:hypothetical protein
VLNVPEEKKSVYTKEQLEPYPYFAEQLKKTDITALLDPLTFEGKQIYRDLTGDIIRGTFAITSACADPAALLRWVDVLYTEEGAIEAMAGKVDDCWSWNADGTWYWHTDEETKYRISSGTVSITDTGEMPLLFPKEFNAAFSDKEISHITAQCDVLTPYLKAPFPSYTLTADQRAQLLPLQARLGPCVDMAIANFVLGETAINEETLADFRATLTENGAAELTAFWQSVADSLNP